MTKCICVYSSFLYSLGNALDVDASGDLSKNEVMAQLRAKTGVFADASAAQVLSEERWKELDWDGDGQIAFREFIWAFQGWISSDGEGDED